MGLSRSVSVTSLLGIGMAIAGCDARHHIGDLAGTGGAGAGADGGNGLDTGGGINTGAGGAAGGDVSVARAAVSPEYCSPDGWCGARVSFGAVTGTAANDVWILAPGTPIQWDGTRWTSHHVVDPASGQPFTLRGLWNSGPNDVWAAGYGFMVHWDGATWTPFAVHSTFVVDDVVDAGYRPPLEAVWGAASDDVWAVGGSRSIIHWNGQIWEDYGSRLVPSLRAVWGTAKNDVWAVGDAGLMVHWDGRSWTTYQDAFGGTATTADLTGVWGSAGNDVWAIGAGAVLLHWDGVSWQSSRSALPTSARPTSIRGSDARNIWVTTTDSSLLHWDGQAWYTAPAPRRVLMSGATSSPLAGTYPLNGVWVAPGGGEVWAVGEGSVSVHWDGASWRVWQAGLFANDFNLETAWVSSASDVWISGDAWWMHWDGESWTRFLSDWNVQAASIWGTGAGDVWALDRAGYLLQLSGGNYGAISRAPGIVTSLWASGPDDIWAVGPAGALVHWDGASWTTAPSPAGGVDLTSVWGSGKDDVWITTASDAILRWDGQAWSSLSMLASGGSVDNTTWRFVTGSAANDVWVIGSAPWSGYMAGGVGTTIRRWDGTQWSEPLTTTSSPNLRLWVEGPGDAWFVDGSDIIQHWDGIRWSAEVTVPSVGFPSDDVGPGVQSLQAIAGARTDLWAVGSQGVVLHKRR